MKEPEKTKRNYLVVSKVLEGEDLHEVAEELGVSDVRVGQICHDTFRKLLPGEERLRFRSPKVAAMEYKEQLKQSLLSRINNSKTHS